MPQSDYERLLSAAVPEEDQPLAARPLSTFWKCAQRRLDNGHTEHHCGPGDSERIRIRSAIPIRFSENTMIDYEIEVAEDEKTSSCHCCGKESSAGHGFVYKEGSAYAIYGAEWSTMHSRNTVNFALAIGEWDDDGTPKDHTVCFGIQVFDDGGDASFRVIDPEESPWSDSDLMGPMLGRNEGLRHPLLKEVFSIIEVVIRRHPSIRDYLSHPAVLAR